MGQALPLFLVIHLAIASSFITYYLITTGIFHHCVNGGKFLNDPIIGVPENLKNREERSKALSFHVAVTASYSVYERWQCRIMYYWYKKKKGSDMGGFTRILHSTKPDKLMDEIPTFLVDPLPSGLDRGYIVLNRPWAFVQWLEKTNIVEELIHQHQSYYLHFQFQAHSLPSSRLCPFFGTTIFTIWYVLMAEPDHIFLKPLPNLADGKHPVAFPFFYIQPIKHKKIIRKFYHRRDKTVSTADIDPIGNSPVIIRKDVLKKIAPTWMKVALKMKEDPETDNAFGWVLEMYAYAIASTLHEVSHILRKDLMIQPPSDYEIDDTFIIHYTYGLNYNLKGEWIEGNNSKWRFNKTTYELQPPPRNMTLPPQGVPKNMVELIQGNNSEWRFSKRSYNSQPPPRNISLPPPGVPKSVMILIQMINEATANIPNWDKT